MEVTDTQSYLTIHRKNIRPTMLLSVVNPFSVQFLELNHLLRYERCSKESHPENRLENWRANSEWPSLNFLHFLFESEVPGYNGGLLIALL